MNAMARLLGVLAACALAWGAAPARGEGADALRPAIAAERQRAPAPAQPRDAFMQPDAMTSARLSPDGRQVAYLRHEGATRSLWAMPTAGGTARRLLARTDATQVHWSRDSRWLFVPARASLAILPLQGTGGLRLPLGGQEAREVMRVDPSQPAAVLLRERRGATTADGWRILRLDARGRRTVLREDKAWIHEVVVDARGSLAALSRHEGGHDAVHRVGPGGRLHEVLRLAPMERGALLGMSPDGDLWLRSSAGGDLQRILRLDSAGVLHTVHQDPRGEADLDALAQDPLTQAPLVASYRSTIAATHGIGEARPQVAAITRRFAGRDVAIQVGRGPGARWLVAEHDSTLRDPRWHLYDPATGGFRAILGGNGKATRVLPEAALARKLHFSYQASDGRRVHGFLLVPPGRDPARLPLLAQVHGGPISHFRPGFDGIAQLLANRGYVVFQSNFRGSTGHGRGYVLSAGGDFGNGRVQRDVVEGVRHLLARGIGDPRRVGIVGHSFGGYSALLGATFSPELFKVAVAGAPPADLAWSMRWLLDAGDQGALPDRSLAATLRLLSLHPEDPATRQRLQGQSPLANAHRLRRPVLLLAGGADRVVAIREVTHYAARLKQLGKQATLFVEPGGGHSPVDPLPRQAYAYLMEAMLHAHLGGAEPEAPGVDLRAYLRANLRMAGPEFAGLAPRAPR